MVRLFPVLVALLLLPVGAAPSVGSAPSGQATAPATAPAPPATTASGGDRVTARNSTTVLLVPDPNQGAFSDSATGLGAALDIQRSGFDGRLSRYALEARFERRSTTAPRQELLGETLDRAERRVDALSAEENRARTAYVNGSIGAEAYVRRLARIHASATAVDHLVSRVESFDGESGDAVFANRTRYLRLRLTLLEGPVRDRAAAALQGTAPPLRVYVAGSTSGTTLTAVSNGTYLSETTRLDNYDGAQPGTSVDLDAAFDRAAALYPYAWNQSSGQRVDALGTNAYRITLPYGRGTVRAYVDGTTDNVFREVQTKALDEVALGPASVERRDDITLTANRTHAGGPLRVRLTDGDGDPIQGTIRVEGTPVGTTTNGTLWTVGFGSEFVVSAEHSGTQVPLIVRPVSQTPATNRTGTAW